MKLLFIGLLTFTSIPAAGQQEKVREKILVQRASLAEGKVILKSGEELHGYLKYNDITGILTYENGNDSRSFSSRSASAFEFFDVLEQRNRVFYSLVLEKNRDGFYEVLKEFKDFAVLSRVDQLEAEQSSLFPVSSSNHPTGTTMQGGTTSTSGVRYRQTETICFMDPDGKVWEFLEIIEKEDAGAFDRMKTKNKLLDESLLARFTGEHYNQIMEFVDKHTLSLKHRSDLIKVLDYYANVVGQ